MILLLIYIIIIILFFSAIFSLIETSIFTVKDIDIDLMIRKKIHNAKKLKQIKKDLSSTISSIVILNNTSNIMGSIFVGYISAKAFDSYVVVILSIVLTLLIIIFGEIIPKKIGSLYANQIAIFFAKPLLFTIKILTPLIYPIKILMSKIDSKKQPEGVSEEEIKFLGTKSAEQGIIEEDENLIIQNAFKLNDVCVREVMTPKNVMNTISEDDFIVDVVGNLENVPHSRLPVISSEDKGKIVGVCLQRQIFNECYHDKSKKLKVRNIMKDIIFVDENECLNSVLKDFLRLKQHLAIVKTEFDVVLGVVTLEDVTETLIGEIVDETDLVSNLRQKAKQNLQ